MVAMMRKSNGIVWRIDRIFAPLLPTLFRRNELCNDCAGIAHARPPMYFSV